MPQDSDNDQVVENPNGDLENVASTYVTSAEIRSPETFSYPGIGQAIRLLLMLLGIQLLISIPIVISGAIRHPLALVIPTIVGTAIVVSYGFKKAGALFQEIFPLSAISIILLLGLLLAVLGLFLLAGEINSLLVWIFPPPANFSQFMREMAGGGQSKWQSFLLTAIVAPLAEEFLFRGLILHGFLKRYSVKKAIIGSAFLFALMHGNPWQFVTALLLGIFLAWCRVKAHSLVPCIFAHFANNAIGFALILLQSKSLNVEAIAREVSVGQHLYVSAVGLLLAASGIYVMKRSFNLPHQNSLAGNIEAKVHDHAN